MTKPVSKNQERQARAMPDGSQCCVWMSAGLVAYKLCDRGFDCDSCPLDRALRGPVAGAECGMAARNAGAAPGPWRSDRRYHAGHTWAELVGPSRYRVGVDAFAARLVGWARSIILPPVGVPVRQGRVGCWVTAHGSPIPIRMPLSGVVVVSNPWVRQHPGLVIESPDDEGWLLEIFADDPDSEWAALDSPEVAAARAETDLRRFHAGARAHLDA